MLSESRFWGGSGGAQGGPVPVEGAIFEQNFFCNIFKLWYLAHKKWVLLSKFQNLLFMNRPSAHSSTGPQVTFFKITMTKYFCEDGISCERQEQDRPDLVWFPDWLESRVGRGTWLDQTQTQLSFTLLKFKNCSKQTMNQTRRCTTVWNSDDQTIPLRWAQTPICILSATAASTASTASAASAHQQHQRISREINQWAPLQNV